MPSRIGKGQVQRNEINLTSNTCSIPWHNQNMPAYAPPGWPSQVRPPDAPGWERSAANWMLDLCPPEYRAYAVIRRHLVVLARFTVLHIEACQASCTAGLRAARVSLREVSDADTVEAAVRAWQSEEARLAAVRREVGLVEDAVRGRRFVARL